MKTLYTLRQRKIALVCGRGKLHLLSDVYPEQFEHEAP